MLAVGSGPWPTVRTFTSVYKAFKITLKLDKQCFFKVGEWGGGDCGPVLVGGQAGVLSVVTLLRQ